MLVVSSDTWPSQARILPDQSGLAARKDDAAQQGAGDPHRTSRTARRRRNEPAPATALPNAQLECERPGALRLLRDPNGLRLPLFQYSECDRFRWRRIFRNVYLRRLLQEQFAFTNHNRWPSFLRRCLGSLDHVAERISRMVVL